MVCKNDIFQTYFLSLFNIISMILSSIIAAPPKFEEISINVGSDPVVIPIRKLDYNRLGGYLIILVQNAIFFLKS